MQDEGGGLNVFLHRSQHQDLAEHLTAENQRLHLRQQANLSYLTDGRRNERRPDRRNDVRQQVRVHNYTYDWSTGICLDVMEMVRFAGARRCAVFLREAVVGLPVEQTVS